MRVATWGTDDVTRQTPEQKASGEMRGFDVMHESAMVAVGMYSLFEFARVSLRPIAFRVYVDFGAVGGDIRHFDVGYYDSRQIMEPHYESSAAYLTFLKPVWWLLNEHAGRTKSEATKDQARLYLAACRSPTTPPSHARLIASVYRRSASSAWRPTARSRPCTRCAS